MKNIKRILAIAALICIIFSVCMFLYSAVTGSEFSIAWYFVAVFVPFVIWAFLRVVEIFGGKDDKEE